MKNLYLIIFTFFATTIFAQQEVILNIDHKLGSESFSYNTNAENNFSDKFFVTRLEYYISQISITHDGGEETSIDDLWILVDGGTPVQKNLGTLNINTIESVNFYIGVNPEHNHLDPSSYPPTHPLAPKDPSMHWGWDAGYRFIALEGRAGDELDKTFQFHGLGDSNYAKTSIDIEQRAANDQLHIDLSADYIMAMNNIDLSQGTISHGETGDAKASLQNFNTIVFSQAGPVSTSSLELGKLKVSPNPSYNGTVSLDIPQQMTKTYTAHLTDLLGRNIASFKLIGMSNAINVNQKGVFFLNVESEEYNFPTQRIIIR